MKKGRDTATPDNADAVGYGRPPRHTRFQPGCSGNPKGRPKGSRSVGAILQDVMSQKIAVTEQGKTRRMPVIEAMLRRLLDDALRGEEKALKLLLSLVERYGDPSDAAVALDDLLAEDAALLARYLPQKASAVSDASLQSDDPGPRDAKAADSK
jgi:hypothetical protein